MENIMSTAIVSERCCISCLQRKLNFLHYVYNMCVCGNILTCLWICVCIQAYFSVFMSWAEAHAAQDMRRNLSGASPCKHFCYYSTPALITLGLFRCALWPRLTAMASCETLSLSAWCGDRGDRGAAKATCQVWGEAHFSCLKVQRGNWLRFNRRKSTEFELQCECILLPLLHVTLL